MVLKKIHPVVFRTIPVIFRTNPVIFRTNPVTFRTNSVIFRTTWDIICVCRIALATPGLVTLKALL